MSIKFNEANIAAVAAENIAASYAETPIAFIEAEWPAVGSRFTFSHKWGDEGPGNWTRTTVEVTDAMLQQAKALVAEWGL